MFGADIPPDYVVGLHIFRPGELPKYNFISFSDDFFFLDVILTKNTQHIRHLLLSRCRSEFERPPVINIMWPRRMPDVSETAFLKKKKIQINSSLLTGLSKLVVDAFFLNAGLSGIFRH